MRNLWLSKEQSEELPKRVQFLCDICHSPADVLQKETRLHYCKYCSYKRIDFRETKYWDMFAPLSE